MSLKQIIGAGGDKGGGSSSSPTEDPDSLQSHQYAQVIDLKSEGPIKGLVNGLHSVYLDDTPILAQDGSANFTGVTLETRLGTNDQTPIPGFAQVDNETLVDVRIAHSTPVTRTISGEIDSATVTIGVPQLTKVDTKTGDMHGSSVSLQFELQNNGGGFQVLPLGRAWSPDSNTGVSGLTITRDACYGIGITFTVLAGIESFEYFDPSGGGSGNEGDGEGAPD